MIISRNNLLAVLLAWRCDSFVAEAEIVNACVQEFDPTEDYFPAKYVKPTIASYGNLDISGEKFVPHNTTDLLEIKYHNNYKIIYNHFQNVSYLLYQCGTEPPQEEVDSGRHNLILEVPHQGGVAVTSTVQIPPLELLGLRTEIKAYIGDPQYVSSPCLIHMMEQGDVERVWENWNSTKQDAARADFLERNPDVIIFGGPYDDKNSNRVVSIAGSQERTNVATFDWIALYAALYNKEAMSNRIRAETQADYDCSSANARLASSTQRKAEVEENNPVLLWANWFEGYNWSVAECSTWDETYYCEYAKHCNIDIISRPEGFGWNNPDFGGRYWYLNDEQFLELGKNADYWIYPSQFWDKMYEKKKDVVHQMKAYQTKQVFDTQGMGENSWYEQRLAEYDVVGLDMCDIVGHTTGVHKRRWIRNIFTDPIGSLPACNVNELDAPYVPEGTDCVPFGQGGIMSGAILTFPGVWVLVGLVGLSIGLF